MKYAGFWIRLIAEFVDSTLLTVASFALVFVFFGMVYWIRFLTGVSHNSSFSEVMDPFWFQILDMIFYAALAFPYYVWFHYKTGTTLGKRFLGIYVVNAKDHQPITLRQSVIRCLGYVVSGLPFLCGYLMAAFQPEKRALHDLMAGTVSVVKPNKKS